MPYVVTEPCIGVKEESCMTVCPVNAIFVGFDIPPRWRRFIQ